MRIAPEPDDCMIPGTSDRVAALILAGGGARRMGGGDKPLRNVDGRPMLARIIAALGVRYVAISANGNPDRFAAFDLPVLSDGVFAGQGPLAGVLAGLAWAASLRLDALLTVPGDTPFVPSGLAAALWPPPACAASLGRPHYLTALWPVTCHEQLAALLAAPGPRSVARFAAVIGMRAIDFAVQTWDPFFNVNTLDDLDTACTLARAMGTEDPR
jgi:molybdenum cofactor guanylyltransferase